MRVGRHDNPDHTSNGHLTLATPDLAADVHYTALRVARERDLLSIYAPGVGWDEYAGGSGNVAWALAEGRADIGVGLTDSLILERARGAPYRLVATFVASPLTWRVLVRSAARAREVEGLRGETFGITRAGGGAHTMLLLLAADTGWRADVDYAVAPIGSLDALLRALKEDMIDAFLWEALTVERWLAAGVVRAVGTVVPPWPAFSIAARTDAIAHDPDGVHGALRALRRASAAVVAASDEMVALVARHYALPPHASAGWLAHVRYADDGALSRRAIEAAVTALRRTGAIEGALPVEDIVDHDHQFAPLLA